MMTSRNRINAAINFHELDRVPFDFFDEAGYLFSGGKYDPSLRLGLDYKEQVEARVKFHRSFNTDLIFDVPVLIPSKIPCQVRLSHNGKEIHSPSRLFSSVSGMAWNSMPPKLFGDGLLEKASEGKVVKNVEWANGVVSQEEIDLATGTTDVLKKAFDNLEQLRNNLDCARGEMSHADFSYVDMIRMEVGSDVMLSGTVIDPFSVIGWYIGIEELMISMYDNERDLLSICDALTEVVVDSCAGMLERGFDMLRLGAATACLLSPELFDKFCAPFQKRIAEAVDRSGGIVCLHMCGKVRNLLGAIAKTGVPAMETITPPPLGDTTLAEARRIVGDKMCLKGNLSPLGKLLNGTPDEALREAGECLVAGNLSGGHIFSVADNLAKGTPKENIEAIAEFLQKS